MNSLDAPAYVAYTHECPDCLDTSRLAVRWNGTAEEIICHRCGRRDGFRAVESLTAQWRRAPESIPVQIADKLERKYGMTPMSGQELALANESTMLARIKTARWLKNVSAEDQASLAQLSNLYGFDPLMQELIIYEGKPYITVAGLIRMAHRQKLFAGVEDRPMTEGERKQYGYAAPLCWIAKVYRKDWHVPAVGTGKADPEKPFRNNMIEKDHPEWMARSRALRQALKLAFPHFLPFEQMDSAEERGIDPETGEIIEGQVFEVPGIVHDGEGIPHFAEPTPANGRAEQPKAAPQPAAKPTGQPGARIMQEPSPMPAGYMCQECIRQREPSTIAGHQAPNRYWSVADIVERSSKQYGEELCWNHLQARLRGDKERLDQAALDRAVEAAGGETQPI